MNWTVVPVDFCIRMPVTFAAAFWSTKVTWPGGLAFMCATRPFKSSAGSPFRAIISCGLLDTMPIGLKSFCRW